MRCFRTGIYIIFILLYDKRYNFFYFIIYNKYINNSCPGFYRNICFVF